MCGPSCPYLCERCALCILGSSIKPFDCYATLFPYISLISFETLSLFQVFVLRSQFQGGLQRKDGEFFHVSDLKNYMPYVSISIPSALPWGFSSQYESTLCFRNRKLRHLQQTSLRWHQLSLTANPVSRRINGNHSKPCSLQTCFHYNLCKQVLTSQTIVPCAGLVWQGAQANRFRALV